MTDEEFIDELFQRIKIEAVDKIKAEAERNMVTRIFISDKIGKILGGDVRMQIVFHGDRD